MRHRNYLKQQKHFARASHYSGDLETEPAYEDLRSETLLKNYGMSVFRSASQEDINTAISVFARLTKRISVLQRGLSNEKAPAVNLLQMREMRHHARVLGSMSMERTIDALYEDVPSLRQPLELGTAAIKLFGDRNGPMRSVVIAFDQPARDQLAVERQAILSVIENESFAEPDDFRWMPREPHVSLGKIASDTPRVEMARILNALDSVRPATVSVERATIHNPSQRVI